MHQWRTGQGCSEKVNVDIPKFANLSRQQLIEQYRKNHTAPPQDPGYQPWTGTEDKYSFEDTLSRFPAPDLNGISAQAEAHAEKSGRSGKIHMGVAIPLWVAGAAALCLGSCGLAIPALAVGSIGYFRGTHRLAEARHDHQLIQDMQYLASPGPGRPNNFPPPP